MMGLFYPLNFLSEKIQVAFSGFSDKADERKDCVMIRGTDFDKALHKIRFFPIILYDFRFQQFLLY